MTDTLLQMGLSNACIAAGLAGVAMLVGWKARRPQLAHMLWLLVFVKLVTPPLVSIPVVMTPGQSETTLGLDTPSPSARPIGEESTARHLAIDVNETPQGYFSASVGCAAIHYGKRWFPPVWLLGTVVVFTWSLVRVWRFGRLLQAESEVASNEVRTAAAKIAHRLRMKRVPTVWTTSARLSPMVWWAGGAVRIVIPSALVEEMDAAEWQWVLAHELAHVRRRDHAVRWLEWLACVGFWWNPVVWWAQRNLRATEEICCDALVLSSLTPKPQYYANSLLKAVEFLASSALRPPAVASEINSGGFLERRFRMIVSQAPNRATSRWLKASVLLCAVAVLPFGVAYATDYDAVDKRLGKAVEKGELTPEQARVMMDALKNPPNKNGDEDAAARMDEWLKGVGERLKGAVKEGKLTEEGAWKKWLEIKEKRIAPRLKEAVAAGKMSEEKAKAVWKGIEKAEIGEKLKAAVAKGELTEKEAKVKWAAINKEGDRDEGVVGHFKKMGIPVEMLGRVKNHLAQSGVSDTQMERTFGGMLRVIHGLKSKGKDFKLDPRLKDYFKKEVGLTDKQIEMVQGISLRIVHGMTKSDRKDCDDEAKKRDDDEARHGYRRPV